MVAAFKIKLCDGYNTILDTILDTREFSMSLDELKEGWKDLNYEKLLIDGAISIKYSELFRTACGIMHAAMRQGEKSARALRLTGEVIHISPANYTAFEYRQNILKQMGKEAMVKDLKWSIDQCLENPKNYQVWHHRRWLAERVGNIQDEFTLVQAIFAEDPKNYHAWGHRTWAVTYFHGEKQFDDDTNELILTEKLLEDDPRNNSVWNYRFFILKLLKCMNLNDELRFAITQMQRAPRNASVWTYIRALLRFKECSKESLSSVRAAVEEVLSDDPSNVPARLSLVHLLKTSITNGDRKEQMSAVSHVELLGEKYDSIRRQYWRWCADQLKAL